MDQAHEQNNKCVKEDGGAVGLTESPSQLLRWMVSGPELARIIGEFETSVENIVGSEIKLPALKHHEQARSRQIAFNREVQSLTSTIEGMGNPFTETSGDMLVLDTRQIVDGVKETVNCVEDVGEKQFNDFVSERLILRVKPIMDVIKKNKIVTFGKTGSTVKSTKQKKNMTSMKQNCALFGQLYISCQVRQGDLGEFFCP